MWIIGLTGAIAMGKSTVAAIFTAQGCAHFDADATVHQLYAGEAVPWFKAHFPHCVTDNSVNRELLSRHLAQFPDDLKSIEATIHPLLWEKKQQAWQQAWHDNAPAIIYDIPILFEKGQEKTVDIRVTVSCSPHTQRLRALARPNMTEEKLAFILARQWADAKKRAHSHVTINTDVSLEQTAQQVMSLLNTLKGR